MVGPVFILLVQTAVTKGFFFCFLAGLGTLVSDLAILILCLNGFRVFVSGTWVGIAGIAILLATGISLILSPKKQYFSMVNQQTITPASGTISFIHGFAINTFSPFVYLFWAGISVMLNERFTGTTNAYFFIVGMCLSISVFNILKVSLPRKITFLLTPSRIQIVSKLSGLFMLVFAAILGIKLVLEK